MHDQQSFDQATRPLLPHIYGAALRFTRDPSDAEDLAQDTMVRAWRFRHTFIAGSNVKSWLFTILRNTFINGFHRAHREADLASDVHAQMLALGPAVALGSMRETSRRVDDVIDEAELAASVVRAMEAMNPEYRLAVELADIGEFTYKEIAKAMGCPIGTVMSRIYRGRKALHEMLGEHEQTVAGPIDWRPASAIVGTMLSRGMIETDCPDRLVGAIASLTETDADELACRIVEILWADDSTEIFASNAALLSVVKRSLIHATEQAEVAPRPTPRRRVAEPNCVQTGWSWAA